MQLIIIFLVFVFHKGSSRTNFISALCSTEPKQNTSFVRAPSRKPFYWSLWAVSWQWHETGELEDAVKETSLIFKSPPSMTLSRKQAKGQSCPRETWPVFDHLSTAVDLPAAFSGQELTEILGKKPDNHPESQSQVHENGKRKKTLWVFFPSNNTVKSNKHISKYLPFPILYNPCENINYYYFIILLLLSLLYHPSHFMNAPPHFPIDFYVTHVAWFILHNAY